LSTQTLESVDKRPEAKAAFWCAVCDEVCAHQQRRLMRATTDAEHTHLTAAHTQLSGGARTEVCVSTLLSGFSFEPQRADAIERRNMFVCGLLRDVCAAEHRHLHTYTHNPNPYTSSHTHMPGMISAHTRAESPPPPPPPPFEPSVYANAAVKSVRAHTQTRRRRGGCGEDGDGDMFARRRREDDSDSDGDGDENMHANANVRLTYDALLRGMPHTNTRTSNSRTNNNNNSKQSTGKQHAHTNNMMTYTQQLPPQQQEPSVSSAYTTPTKSPYAHTHLHTQSHTPRSIATPLSAGRHTHTPGAMSASKRLSASFLEGDPSNASGLHTHTPAHSRQHFDPNSDAIRAFIESVLSTSASASAHTHARGHEYDYDGDLRWLSHFQQHLLGTTPTNAHEHTSTHTSTHTSPSAHAHASAHTSTSSSVHASVAQQLADIHALFQSTAQLPLFAPAPAHTLKSMHTLREIIEQTHNELSERTRALIHTHNTHVAMRQRLTQLRAHMVSSRAADTHAHIHARGYTYEDAVSVLERLTMTVHTLTSEVSTAREWVQLSTHTQTSVHTQEQAVSELTERLQELRADTEALHTQAAVEQEAVERTQHALLTGWYITEHVCLCILCLLFGGCVSPCVC
jgi:hypothetical protein